MMMGDSASDGGEPFAKGSANYKGCILHKLRMEYVDVMRGYLPDRQYLRYLNDSVEARQARAAGRRHNMPGTCRRGFVPPDDWAETVRRRAESSADTKRGSPNMPPLL